MEWLLTSGEPAVRRLARRDLMGEADPPEDVLAGPWVRALLDGLPPAGNPYRKWQGAHWRLVSLVELEVPPTEPRVAAGAESVMAWLARPHGPMLTVKGLPLAHASVEGNAVAACSRLGYAHDPRIAGLVAYLLERQWPDGGWNCDARATGKRSSFHETLIPMWGLHEYAIATGDQDAAKAARRAAELLLEHRLFRSTATGAVIDRRWLVPKYPPYWHYDILHALVILGRMDLLGDHRTADALAELEQQRQPDGRWAARASWWRPGVNEVVDWGHRGPNQMITLNALRVLP